MATKTKGFAVCLRNNGYAASLEVRKLYPIVPDAEAGTHGLIRVIDESGEDYLYPLSMFREITLPADLERTLKRAS
jgi:hypothetical protein